MSGIVTSSEKLKDPMVTAVAECFQSMRENANATWELEIRQGVINYQNGDFAAGLPQTKYAVLKRLLTRLKNNVKEEGNRWTNLPVQKYLRAYYPDNIRGKTPFVEQDAMATQKAKLLTEHMRKTVDRKITVRTDREVDFRCALSREEKLELLPHHKDYAKVMHSNPLMTRVVMRESFIEKITEDWSFQYDLSRVSDEMKNKGDVNNKFTLEIELEFRGTLKRLPDRALEQEENEMLARLMLDRAVALLGTYYIRSETQWEELPPPRLRIV